MPVLPAHIACYCPRNEQHSIAVSLERCRRGGLDPRQLVRLLVGRGTPTNIDCIAKVNALPGGDPSARGRATARDVAVTAHGTRC